MLRKLLKHEFRATARVMLPVYLVLLVSAVGANFSAQILNGSGSRFLNILGGLMIMAYTLANAAVWVVTFVLMVQRFYKNLLEDEGYVMLTLPVSIHQQVWSKLIVSAVWFAGTFLAMCLSILVMSSGMGDALRGMAELMSELFRRVTAYYALNGTAIAAELLVLCFLGCCMICLQFYAAMAVGYSFSNHKGILSAVFFFAFQFAAQALGLTVLSASDGLNLFGWLSRLQDTYSAMTAIHLTILLMTAGVVLYGMVFYFLTTYFLKRHLSLE